MRNLHQNWSWVDSLIGVSSIAIGLSFLGQVLIPKTLSNIKELELSKDNLKKELSERKRADEQRTRLLAETEFNLQRSRTLYEISLATNSTLNHEGILSVLLEKIDNLLPHSAATTIRLFSKETGELELIACRHVGEEEWRAAVEKGRGGLSRTVFKNKAPLIIGNVQTDSRTLDPEFFREHGLVSFLGVPLITKGEVLGVLSIFTKEKHQFSDHEVQSLSMLAGQLAMSIHNSQLYEQSQRREEIQGFLKELSQDITSLDINSLLKKLTLKACEFFKADASDIRLSEGGRWKIKASSGIDASAYSTQPEAESARGNYGIGWIAKNRKPLMIRDMSGPEGRMAGRTVKELRFRGYLGVPVIAKSMEAMGILRLLTYQPREFSQEEVDLLQQLANGVAIALENARLLDHLESTNLDLQRSTEEQRALREFSFNLLFLDLDELLQRMTQQAALLFQAEFAWLRLFDEKGRIRTRAVAGDEEVIRLMASGGAEKGMLVGRGRWMLDNRRPLAVKDMAQETDKSGRGVEAGLHGFLGTPLFSRDQKTLGVLHLMTRSPRDFSQHDLDLIGQFAHGAALAIESARLFKEIRASQENLEKSNANLTRSNAELAQFTNVASHDLQEPMRKIQAFADRLKTKYNDVLGDQGRDYLERMRNAAARMQDLINDLLAYSQVTTNTQLFVPVDLAKLTQEVLSDLEVRIEQAGGRVELGELPTIDADPAQMRQLLQNLISNALKFHREGEAPVVKINSHPLDGQGSSTANGSCQIVVEDNGIGFDEKYLDRIFATFQRLHGRNEYEGSGIGLAICRKIAEHHGGSITAKSTPGLGTAFIINLPLQQTKSLTGETDNEIE